MLIAGAGGHYIGDHLSVIMVLSRDHLSSYLMLHLLITYNASKHKVIIMCKLWLDCFYVLQRLLYTCLVFNGGGQEYKCMIDIL